MNTKSGRIAKVVFFDFMEYLSGAGKTILFSYIVEDIK